MNREWLFAAILVVLAGFAATAPVVPVPSQVSPEKSEKTEATYKAADKNSGKTTIFARWGANEWIALFTAGTLAVLIFQLRAARRANEHSQVIERAYVKLSHKSPGIDWESPLLGQGTVTIQVTNFGQTPADVSDAYAEAIVRYDDGGIEDHPPYSPAAAPERLPETAFLVKDDRFFFSAPIFITPTQRQEVDEGKCVLIVIGYVDYTDKFEARHRGGYARMYDPSVDKRTYRTPEDREARNNLPIFPHPDWNFDRERKPGVLRPRRFYSRQKTGKLP